MLRFVPDLCVLDTSECWNFQDICASCAQKTSGAETGLAESGLTKVSVFLFL